MLKLYYFIRVIFLALVWICLLKNRQVPQQINLPLLEKVTSFTTVHRRVTRHCNVPTIALSYWSKIWFIIIEKILFCWIHSRNLQVDDANQIIARQCSLIRQILSLFRTNNGSPIPVELSHTTGAINWERELFPSKRVSQVHWWCLHGNQCDQ